ncbi:MAG: dihydroorotate dehydrogenase [bacterium]
MSNLITKLGKIILPNPIMNASGTYDLEETSCKIIPKLGAFVTKTITLKPCEGNLPPRIIEQEQGLLNSIGLQNPGIEVFLEKKLPSLQKLNSKIIVSIAGKNLEEYVDLSKILDKIPGIIGLEINISCPNVKSGTIWAESPNKVYDLISKIRKSTSLFIITKFSPNVTDIKLIAKKAEQAGTDAISLINTIKGMAINLTTKKAVFDKKIGGLSGHCIKPIALRLVWEVFSVVKVPIIGMGGIMNTEDALEFILAGASSLAIGTANFINPNTMLDIIKGIEKYLNKNKIKNIQELIGTLK